MLWSSFEHHLTADRAIGMAGDHFAGVLEANGIAWSAVTDPAERRDIVLQILAQVPALWVWDNIEPVAGFPTDTPSAWTAGEQDELADVLRDLAQQTRCRMLLSSRRHERGWLRDLPARVPLPAMPMRESLQLAAALAARHGRSIADADWRPLLRFAAGNPLTITVVTGQALRENLITTEEIAGFVTRLQAGEAQPEARQDATLGRTRSLAASLDYGFAHAFTNAERSRLAVLHLFRDAVNVAVLQLMGERELCGEDTVPELAEMDRDMGITLLDQATDIGLLSSLGGGYYQIHPALPWYFNILCTTVYGQAKESAAQIAIRAYAKAIAALGDNYYEQAHSGRTAEILGMLRAEEANLLHALDYARAEGLWDPATGCLQGLNVLYERTGRNGEWTRLVAAITPDVTDHATGGPLPGREQEWGIVAGYRARLAEDARDWPAATTIWNALVRWRRHRAAEVLAAPSASLTRDQRTSIHNLATTISGLGIILLKQGDSGCLAHFQEALALDQRIGDRQGEAEVAGNLGSAHLNLPELRDLNQAERWFRHSLGMQTESDGPDGPGTYTYSPTSLWNGSMRPAAPGKPSRYY